MKSELQSTLANFWRYNTPLTEAQIEAILDCTIAFCREAAKEAIESGGPSEMNLLIIRAWALKVLDEALR